MFITSMAKGQVARRLCYKYSILGQRTLTPTLILGSFHCRIIAQLFFVFKSEYGATYGAVYLALAIGMTVDNPYSLYG